MHFRRLLLIIFRRSLFLLILICLGCVAQSAPPDLSRKIEHQVRTFYSLPPEVKVTVGAITPASEVAGYDSVSVKLDQEGKQKDYTFLLSKDRNTMLRVTKFDLSKDAYADLMSKIDLNGRPSRGAKGAKVVVVNFDDFECPFCSRMHQTLFPEILKDYGDRVTFFYKDYPLAEIHPWAIHAAVNAGCLAAQNADAYWDFADYIHANKQVVDNERNPAGRLDAVDKMALLQGQRHNVDLAKLQSCLKAQNEDAVRASMKEADSLGVNATPTLFINGQKVDGAVPIDEVRAALDAALRDAGQPVPLHTPSSPTPASK
ncbi:MAG TPA: thioredoxin domain-containing protein [Candidatus Sulfotelmatobacter sp.]|nr:thioredoxin domain-containing protein [Candidatus Sulfotelmatobacter sp.]